MALLMMYSMKPTIAIVSSPAAAIEVVSGEKPSIEIKAFSQPAIVVNAPMAPAPPALASEVRIDATTAGTIYVGTAPNGSAESLPAWVIVRSLFSLAGVRIAKGVATGVSWNARATAIYS